jgi:hypothetical protein
MKHTALSRFPRRASHNIRPVIMGCKLSVTVCLREANEGLPPGSRELQEVVSMLANANRINVRAVGLVGPVYPPAESFPADAGATRPSPAVESGRMN